MGMVEVWNDNELPFRQRFKEVQINIPANSKIVMDSEEAVLFRSLFFQPQLDADGVQLKSSYKKIRIGKMLTEDEAEKSEEHICHMDGQKFASKAAYDQHIDEEHLNDLLDPDLATKRKMKKS